MVEQRRDDSRPAVRGAWRLPVDDGEEKAGFFESRNKKHIRIELNESSVRAL